MKMGIYRKILTILILGGILSSCEDPVKFPDEPIVSYKSFNLYTSTDILGNTIILGKLEFEFTDGDGDIGLNQPSVDNPPMEDSLKYNLFLNMYAMEDGVFQLVEDEDQITNYRIPFIKQTGQNKALNGTVILDIEYKKIVYDTVFYTFYIMDREFHRSNTDSTDIMIFTGISL